MHRLFTTLVLASGSYAACISSGDQTNINNAFRSGGAGTVVQLCANAVLSITDSVKFTAANQEISTEGYPTGSTRATLKVAKGSNVSTLISGTGYDGVKVRNIQVDGNRPNAGYLHNGGANIELGGTSNGQVIDHVASRNPRGWSCLHVTESGDSGCRNATVINNDIGPCGHSGTNSAGQGQWADGISFACTASEVSDNTIVSPTDGGIVIFGAPGTTITRNTIISSETDLSFGAINLVDPTYNGNYANVKVTDNTIQGRKLFGTGIAIGACTWSGPCRSPYFYKGPTTVTGNKLSGNIAFAIPTNGWSDGLKVTGNDISGVNKPVSSYATDNQCTGAVKTLFESSAILNYYPNGIQGTKDLQSDFVSSSGNGTNFICAEPK
ncbi:hypothetical protein CNMCM7691_006850 [Aspergillus felis]|uniref:Right handed beta helix domain-containing protein n=1 Tax=Aspergillus felis TaxID=1287682 RepID=A0A8H6QS98_9EURO|nr:hypothetical protein CNMCM7691_006850 [Aspergillus felis]